MSDHGQDALRLPKQVDCNDPSGGTDGGAQRHDSRGRFTLAPAAAPVPPGTPAGDACAMCAMTPAAEAAVGKDHPAKRPH